MMRSNHNYHKGFTLIELLVVISIVGVLSSAVLTKLNDARMSAQYTVAQQEMKLISDATLLIDPGTTALRRITNSNCSMCSCVFAWGGPSDLRNLALSATCMRDWERSLTRIDAASSVINNTEPLLRDPWGSPYLLNENEGEYTPPCTYRDYVSSAGPDGRYTSADDFTVIIPFRTSECTGV